MFASKENNVVLRKLNDDNTKMAKVHLELQRAIKPNANFINSYLNHFHEILKQIIKRNVLINGMSLNLQLKRKICRRMKNIMI